MSAEIILWLVGCGVFLLVLLFVVRSYVLQHHDEDDDEAETRDESEAERKVDAPS